MKQQFFTFFPRRIFMRPWKVHVASPYLIGGSIAALLASFYGGSILVSRCGMLNAVIISSAAATLLFLGCTALSPAPGSLAAKIGWRRISARDLGICCGALLIILAGSTLLTFIWQQFLEALQIPHAREQSLLLLARKADAPVLFQLLILTAVTVPFMEELVFRRGLYALLLNLGAPVAMTGTALIFAAAHGFLLGAPGLFFIGLIFQMISNMTRNLWCGIITHAMLNGTVLLLTFAAEKCTAP